MDHSFYCSAPLAASITQIFLSHRYALSFTLHLATPSCFQRILILTKNDPLITPVYTLASYMRKPFYGMISGNDGSHRVAKFGPLGPFVTCCPCCCQLVSQTNADILITGRIHFTFSISFIRDSLIWHPGVLSFVLSRSRTGFKRTDTIINRIIRGAVQTGLFASIFALAELFKFMLHRNTNLY